MINPDNTQEELFALNFELQALSDVLLRGEAERWVPKFLTAEFEKEHIGRYKLAVNYVSGKKVLDIACGSGYGSYLLAEEGNANEVLAGDISADSIRYGNHRYSHTKVTRMLADAEKFSKPGYFDVVVSFETIEHLQNPELFLKNVVTSLVDAGYFLVSTPIAPKTTTNCYNPYHAIEWSFQDFQQLLSKYFDIEEVYVQNLYFNRPKPNIAKKVYTKVLNNVYPERITHGPLHTNKLEKYQGQYSVEKIEGGYQLLICRQKSKK
jgi:2-polyprenyl-3-methyl-5-hydroxy-6-metoxy-1,4-benzoquinol methylase